MWRSTADTGPIVLEVEVLVPVVDWGEAAVVIARYTERVAFSGVARSFKKPVLIRAIELRKTRDPVILVKVARSSDVPQKTSAEVAEYVTAQIREAIRDRVIAAGYA